MAPSSSSRPPTKKTIGVKKKTKATKFASNRNETSLNICWDPSKMETDSPPGPGALDEILKAMGVDYLSAEEQTDLVRKYKSCHAKMTGKKSKMIAPKLHEVLQLMKDWSPKTDLICLHVRWAKKSPRNFHLDSISTLLTVAHQCGFDPVDFLIKANYVVSTHPLWVHCCIKNLILCLSTGGGLILTPSFPEKHETTIAGPWRLRRRLVHQPRK
jgi:hypothetical protein